MPRFKCIKTHTEKETIQRKQIRRANDTVTVVERSVVVEIKPGAYGHENIELGETYEIGEPLASKARKNTEYFTEIIDEPEVVAEPESAVETEPEVAVEQPLEFGKQSQESADGDGG